jgi:beta-glucosidase
LTEEILRFPTGFRWGCATAAHQVEGGNTNNDWHAWEEAGNVHGGQTAGKACDWWNMAEADLKAAVSMGQNSHRMSVEWSRIEPREGVWDDAAIDRYRAILQCMRDHGLEPMVTLHHFTTPLWLSHRGGWENPGIIPFFERFAEKMARTLGEYCGLWITLNEPVIYAVLGWLRGVPRNATQPQSTFPPGKHDLLLTFRVLDNLFLGHAAAYRALHRQLTHAQVGIGHNMPYIVPYNPKSLLDRIATVQPRRLLTWGGLEATERGRLPRLIGSRYVKELVNSTDFIGVQYYQRLTMAFDFSSPGTVFSQHTLVSGAQVSDLGHSEIYPEGLYQLLRQVSRYGKPIYITENGVADANDGRRPEFLINHLMQVWKAIHDGVPVKGYYHWSLTDNFEWAEGWNLRFGLIEVDPITQERRMRPSGKLYSAICSANALTPQLVAPIRDGVSMKAYSH